MAADGPEKETVKAFMASTPLGPSPSLAADSIAEIAMYFAGHVVASHLGAVSRAWRAATSVDTVWARLVARDFPASCLQPWPGAPMRSVYAAEHVGGSVPVLISPTDDRPMVHATTLHVTWQDRQFLLHLDGHKYVRLETPMDVWKTRRLKNNGWKPVMVVVSEAGVMLRAPSSSKLKGRLPLQYIGAIDARESGEIHITPSTGSRYTQSILLRSRPAAAARLWAAAASHNVVVCQAKHDEILSAPSVQSRLHLALHLEAAERFQAILALRKLHAFRLAQDVFKTPREAPPRRVSISHDVVHALSEKQQLSAPRDAVPKKAGSFSLRRLRRSPIHRECAALHLVPEPALLVASWLRDRDTFEGHACARFVATAKARSMAAPPPQCHAYLCDVRDVIAHISRYVLAYRRSELGAFDLSPESMEIAVIAAIERKLCMDLAKPIAEWTRGFTTLATDAQVAAKMAQWSKLPPTCAQFGLTPEFLLDWSSVVDQLRRMEAEVLPSGKLRLLLGAAKDIYTTFAKASAAARALAADDFLPVFIFCVCNSKIQAPLATLEYMWSLCSQDSLVGESGYYLTMFEASLEYIRATD
ncbi:hypothetical protein ACHHYP_07192 [Achlya hypogyna]|uniref:VPS9 domain-containing protein n=1 Tax=Achlya hypogyna TaxID=1202772 RepID=A0A1V9ZMM9_ACHHY|nr:hypothetical protein ACHHYP_07192 [Achlya hypogyna]